MIDFSAAIVPAEEAALSTEVLELRDLVRVQRETADRLAQIAVIQRRQVDELTQLLRQRVTVTAKEARGLRRLAVSRCAEIAKSAALAGTAAPALRARLWIDYKRVFGVEDVYDTPAVSLADARAWIAAWSSYAAIRAARRKEGDHGPQA